ncbi:transposase [Kitasatospora sp. NPDC018058]|uniref:transposase n=1 Tax=Kitasatospora sp. NPDC018058 TaxID=3364025 RepID=UPI0037C1B2AC
MRRWPQVTAVDETGDMKRGTHTVGVQRQYTGTDGRSRTLKSRSTSSTPPSEDTRAVDRELYVPRSWTSDPDRCRAARLGEDTVFAAKPEPARTMIERYPRHEDHDLQLEYYVMGKSK